MRRCSVIGAAHILGLSLGFPNRESESDWYSISTEIWVSARYSAATHAEAANEMQKVVERWEGCRELTDVAN